MNLEKVMNTVYSFAAAVVIFGAWAKLEHKEYGSLALTAGLLTEVAIFFLYGILEWRSRPEGAQQTVVLPKAPVQHADRVELPGTPPEAVHLQAEELTSTLKQTNRILNKVFRTD
ncbi:hypothetical protein Q4E93_00890 [Flavitalea sp. BT771]|uniref:GldL-related protein n=1 Tax=Flavitalea sp. BT771 TaxID=3063329 RepID=UPI0026E40C75|nr:hypothetical protein [Flavitalea sp. BT771]MDO6429121.1 hypothetical protein [Flavitalea sp. BT771]MDV6218751.1 hypothetical protein [Flavitalea sp. BT771]